MKFAPAVAYLLCLAYPGSFLTCSFALHFVHFCMLETVQGVLDPPLSRIHATYQYCIWHALGNPPPLERDVIYGWYQSQFTLEL